MKSKLQSNSTPRISNYKLLLRITIYSKKTDSGLKMGERVPFSQCSEDHEHKSHSHSFRRKFLTKSWYCILSPNDDQKKIKNHENRV